MLDNLPPGFIAALIGLITALSGYITYRTKTNTAQITEIRTAVSEQAQTTAQIAEIRTAVSEQVQTTAIIDPAANVAGQWSPEAKEALDKAVPPGADIVKIDDAPTYHIVYWRVKR